ncbi:MULTISPECIES: tyrosine-type recombinase/integrase [unclassified Chryseobacterium]|uniref:tyrosine-type recombinase/integrase n=1 Tax=unclassified Chryseobacterium TaxID=2593645 RepID=UPI0028530965|nr:tyrosine-type recombinase/integrase [Chryseobacterium sp. CFS7]MDR4892303.1 tyrosine-type recombinase/integrase [Chryseobacterium sp. CFS7]
MGDLEIRIYTPKDEKGDYYVYLYNTDTQKVVKKYYKGINISPDPEDRLSAAEDLAKAVSIQLKTGWRPKKKSSLPEYSVEKLKIGNALEKALELISAKGLSPDTLDNYKSTVRIVNEEIIKLGWDKEPLSDLKAFHVETILEKLKTERSWGNTYFNFKKNNLSSLFGILKKKQYIKENIISDIGSLKRDKKRPYIPLTPKEQTKVVKHFNKVLPNYNIWLKTLYHTGLRPKEVRLMKCSMIRLGGGDRDLLVLPPEIIKTDRKRIIPIPEDLRKDFALMDLSNPDYYVFGRTRKYDCFSHDDFKPSPHILGINTASYVWKNEVMIKLGINKHMYSNKHKKANDSIEDGVSLEAVQKLFGHTTPITTEIYAQILELTNFRAIKEKARDFK